jgi:hypothetical protein
MWGSLILAGKSRPGLGIIIRKQNHTTSLYVLVEKMQGDHKLKEVGSLKSKGRGPRECLVNSWEKFYVSIKSIPIFKVWRRGLKPGFPLGSDGSYLIV